MLRASAAVQRVLEYDADGAALEYVMPIDLLRQKFRIQNIVRYLLTGVTVVLLTVGGIGIANVMLVSVLRRAPEIGLRRAVGARREDIIVQFVIESAVVSVAGGLGGVLVGTLVGWLLSLSLGWPVQFGLGTALAGIVVSLLLGISAGTYPALKAASVDPMRTLNQA